MIDIAGADTPHWEGFEFVVNRRVSGPTESSFEICTGGWQWKPVGAVTYRAEGAELHVAVPKKLLGIQGDGCALEFKWIDNTRNPGDILDLYINGDTAPGGRFRYRYDTYVEEGACVGESG